MEQILAIIAIMFCIIGCNWQPPHNDSRDNYNTILNEETNKKEERQLCYNCQNGKISLVSLKIC